MSPSTSHPDGPRPRFFAVVPAAGVGARLGADVPKQYLEIAGTSLLAWSLRPLLRAAWIEQVLVVVAPGDERAARACAALAGGARERLRVVAVGGATRRDSVLAGLLALDRDPGCGGHDWVLVHDAARPGLSDSALARLRDRLDGHPAGGLLALPVADTVKRAGAGGEVAATVPREGLWLAQTPQMFRFGPLRAALERHPEVTDEAAAMEAQREPVLLVAGERRNFKVTTRDDLDMMAALLGDARPADEEAG
ncbi:2-C-methyl-D-erythritol 4-phosphate cytidylyltransferase [Quisquiliibacterium transsilvanicum]|uniref:2-C-methyl-D-erythritol 4-phosphate cytidylyltransferase n=1 Tax=Quisquiliibacterium transsilvanicum TaxID=1549638 RepID=A0A7W8HEN8_9BURK|nr:2-C-methyl-D-erythritol 4-phosphate cytidylyltransferase [Quisquiliibacterium transsilvanicum]MBB5270571.1 2-C-methyl-D-erythritol 4-phosphate cytidylyltransferase [Quisquiliibacterium transsilvanicum]